ncbi:hypothetical protein GCM10022237_50430 [Nocardioides ginsengisoli]|uniref:Uncharacterized protein n=1 Tax=Nocardioides ginsengisoli TaxID=363868 RepID=A0ABW3W2M8_9ACTN
MTEADEEARPGPRIDWPATFAGAGAAVTVAVLLSTLGAAGTLIGAALGSVVATVSTALYKQGIESSRRRMADVQAAALQRVNLADQNVRRAARRSDPAAAERELDRAHRHLDAAGDELAGGEPGGDAPALAQPSRGQALPWKRLAVAAATVFVIAMVAISAVELIAGRSVSTITGGTSGSDRTSISGVLGGGSDSGHKPRRHPTTPTPTPTAPVTTPTAPAPVEPSGAVTGPETPTPTPTPTPSDSASPAPSDTATPTQNPAPTPSDAATP